MLFHRYGSSFGGMCLLRFQWGFIRWLIPLFQNRKMFFFSLGELSSGEIRALAGVGVWGWIGGLVLQYWKEGQWAHLWQQGALGCQCWAPATYTNILTSQRIYGCSVTKHCKKKKRLWISKIILSMYADFLQGPKNKSSMLVKMLGSGVMLGPIVSPDCFLLPV